MANIGKNCRVFQDALFMTLKNPTLEFYTHVTGNIPKHPFPILIYMYQYQIAGTPGFAFVCFEWNHCGKTGKVISPHLPPNKSAWRSHGVVLCGLMKLVRPVSGSIPSEMAMVRSKAGICCWLYRIRTEFDEVTQTIDNRWMIQANTCKERKKKQSSYTSYVQKTEVCIWMSHPNHVFFGIHSWASWVCVGLKHRAPQKELSWEGNRHSQ